MVQQLQPQRLNVSVYLKSTSRTRDFPVACHRSSSHIKSFYDQDSVVWNTVRAQSREQNVVRWEVRMQWSAMVFLLKATSNGPHWPANWYVLTEIFEGRIWQPTVLSVQYFLLKMTAKTSIFSGADSLCCKELRAGASYRWLLIYTGWG